jgi:hypothetical protein
MPHGRLVALRIRPMRLRLNPTCRFWKDLGILKMLEDTADHICRHPSLCQVVLENHTSVSMRMEQQKALHEPYGS